MRSHRLAAGSSVVLIAVLGLRLGATDAVPGVPADRTAWLRSALAQAAPGATIDVPAGLYRGPFTIDRPVRLRAVGLAHLRGDGRTHTVAIRADDVTDAASRPGNDALSRATTGVGERGNTRAATCRGNHTASVCVAVAMSTAAGVDNAIGLARTGGATSGSRRGRESLGTLAWAHRRSCRGRTTGRCRETVR